MNRFGEHLQTLLDRQTAKANEPRKTKGRPPIERDYSNTSIAELTKRLSAVGQLRKLAQERGSIDIARRWDIEIQQLKKYRRKLRIKAAADIRRQNRERTVKARAELARQRTLDKQAR